MKTTIITRGTLLVCLVWPGSARGLILAGELFAEKHAAQEFAKYASQITGSNARRLAHTPPAAESPPAGPSI